MPVRILGPTLAMATVNCRSRFPIKLSTKVQPKTIDGCEYILNSGILNLVSFNYKYSCHTYGPYEESDNVY